MRGVIAQPAAVAHDPARPERRPLRLLCSILSPDAARRNGAVAAMADAELREGVMAVARREGVLPALYEAIAPVVGDVPRAERIPLAISLEANRKRNREIAAAVRGLAAEANSRSVEIVALKGAMWVLEDPVGCAGWRRVGDADILVDAKDLGAMREVLAALGYRAARRERNFLGKGRFEGHYHLVEHKRDGSAFVVEVHRDVGWRPALLSTALIFASRRPIAAGLSLPCPWHAALHAIIHWQIHHYGYQRGLGVTEGLEIMRFLQRDDADWNALAHHAALVGIEREVSAAVAFAAELFGARVPDVLRPSTAARAYVARAVQTRQSRVGMLAAKQRMRLLRLWDDHRFLYRMSLRGVKPATGRLLLWALRLRRVPFIIAHLVSILLLQAAARIARAGRDARAAQPDPSFGADGTRT